MHSAYLVKTGSPAFDKIILSMSSVSLELENLVEQTHFIKRIYEYGESEGTPELQVCSWFRSPAKKWQSTTEN